MPEVCPTQAAQSAQPEIPAFAIAPVIDAVSEGGEPVNAMYFWATGILSSSLDNAPT